MILIQSCRKIYLKSNKNLNKTKNGVVELRIGLEFLKELTVIEPSRCAESAKVKREKKNEKISKIPHQPMCMCSPILYLSHSLDNITFRVISSTLRI